MGHSARGGEPTTFAVVLHGLSKKIRAGTMGLEPTTFCVTGRRSNQLSYTTALIFLL